MKKALFYLAALVIVLASCSKVDQANISGSEALVSITASSDEVKTTASGNKVLWKQGDKIALTAENCGGTATKAVFTTSITEPSASAVFTCESGTAAMDESETYGNHYLALYPSDILVKWGSAGKHTITVDPKSEQDAVKDGWDPSCCVLAAKSDGQYFSFKHVLAYVKFVVGPASTPFYSLQISGANGETMMRRVVIELRSDEITYGSASANASSKVTIAPEGATAFEQGTYYAAILPQTFSGGLVFTFFDEDGVQCVKSVAKEATVAGGDVIDLGTIGALDFNAAAATEDDAKAKLATVYGDDGGANQGIVFYYDASDFTKGKVFSAKAELGIWGNRNVATGATSTTDAEANYNAVTSLSSYKKNVTDYMEESQDTDGKYSFAWAYCDKLRDTYGGNWHLPTQAEANYLFEAYYGLAFDAALATNTQPSGEAATATATKYETAIASISGTAMNDMVNMHSGSQYGVQYWGGFEGTDKTKAHYYRFGKSVATGSVGAKDNNGKATGTNHKYIRCVRDVTLVY